MKLLTTACLAVLDQKIKELNEAKEKKAKPEAAAFAYSFTGRILDRYAEHRAVAVIQKEAMLLFSLSLVAALAASAIFWGLVATALIHADADSLASYQFFVGDGLVEAAIWAWGCMTTTISFPGQLAPVWLKGLHAGILATGLFQLTFLLACFSIMTSSEGTRTAEETRKALRAAREKLDHTKALEAQVIDIVPSGSPDSEGPSSEVRSGGGAG